MSAHRWITAIGFVLIMALCIFARIRAHKQPRENKPQGQEWASGSPRQITAARNADGNHAPTWTDSFGTVDSSHVDSSSCHADSGSCDSGGGGE